MMHEEIRRLGVIAMSALALAGCAATARSSPRPAGVTRQAPALLSAFFGLDHALPARANLICLGAKGQNGMPVVFPLELDIDTLEAGDFAVRTRSGQSKGVHCVSPAPATDPGELRTILLIGDFGSREDPPVEVQVVGTILDRTRQQDFMGRSIEVIPLEAGPTLILAEVAPAHEWSKKTSRGATACPATSRQVVRVTWTGGVTRLDKASVGDAERLAYRVRAVGADGAERDLVPFALGDLGDSDNNHDLCLDSEDRPLSVSFPAGLLVDPADDLNPATRIAVHVPTSSSP